jgi:hypothetical protein
MSSGLDCVAGRLDNLQAYDHPETGAEARKTMGFSPGPGGPESPGGTPFIIDLSLVGKKLGHQRHQRQRR